jgi:hypothetical protein
MIFNLRGKSQDFEALTNIIDIIYNTINKPLKMVEIGSYSGESTEIFLKTNKIQVLYSVDPYEPITDKKYLISKSNMDLVEQKFITRLNTYIKENKLIKIKLKSADYINMFSDIVDFVYIDGDHSYESVKNDINLWKSKINENGFIGGHDYIYGWPGVMKAVNECFTIKELKRFKDTSWLCKVK